MKKINLPAVALLLMCGTALFGQDTPATVKPATIEGLVTKAGTGEPLRGASVTVTGTSGTKSVTTDARGRFVIADLAPGVYNLGASATSFVRVRKNDLHLNLSPDQHLYDLNLQLMPAAAITGHVYDQNGQPLPAVRVEAVRYQYRDGAKVLVFMGTGHSDDRGEYRIYNLQPDAYYVRAIPSPTSLQASLAPVYYPGVVDPQDAAPITLGAGTESSAIDIALGGNRTFSVRLKIGMAPPPGPQAVSFAEVRLDRTVPESIRLQTESLGDGVYRISPFTPGAYEIFAQVRGSASQFSILTARMPVNIASEDVDVGTLAVRPNGTLAGRFVVSEPLPATLDPAIIGIGLRPMAGLPSNLATSSRDPGAAIRQDGTFTIPNVANGRFRIEVTGLPGNVYLTSVRYGGAEVIDSGIEVDGAPQGQLELILGGTASVGAIEGVVKGRNDQVAGNSVVVIVPPPNRRENPAAFRTAITDQRGSFSVQGLLPGEYTLIALEDVDPAAYQNPELLKDFEGSGIKTIVERGSRSVVDIRVIPKS